MSDATRHAAQQRAVLRVERSLQDYFDEYGAEHLDHCPEDDTCDCPLVAEMASALRELRNAVE